MDHINVNREIFNIPSYVFLVEYALPEEKIKIWSDEELTSTVDGLLQLYDFNFDGFVNWVEIAEKSNI